MSDPPKDGALCDRCSLLSFDDAAIGGYEGVGEDGIARLFFPRSKIELHSTEHEGNYYHVPLESLLVRLDWKLDEVLPDMPHLSHSSKLGCAFCQALRKSLEESLPRKAKSYSIDDGPLRLVAFLALNGRHVEGLMIEGTITNARLNIVIQTLFLIEASSGCCEWLGVHSARITSYLDHSHIQQSHRMLNHCTSTCHPETPSSFMPTRLIDIGHDVSVLPRLVLSSNIKHTQQKRYAALSYCWGTETDAKSQFKTEKASLESRYAGLPSELMTPTTNDAIALARAMGVPYLWIDALCIIQDDQDDWSYESSQMNLVYRHAFVTLCSLNSKSCHESFLNPAATVKLPFESRIRKDIKGFYLIRLRPKTGEYLDRRRYDWNSVFSNWYKRCWTFQEQEMSTRLLLVGNQKIRFTCGRSDWTEGDEAPRNRPKSGLGVSDMIASFKDKCMSSRELYVCWESLIHSYGHRSVTFDKDRLPAIAGLARMIGEALQDRYLAGLWEGDLHYGLHWLSSGSMYSRDLKAHIRDIRERNYVAPSWSWAACPSVSLMSRGSTSMIEESAIVNFNTDTSFDDPYGQVSGGFLRIRGKMARLPDWLPKDHTDWSHHWYHLLEDDNCDFVQVVTDWLHKDKEAELENILVLLLFRVENDDEAKAPSLRALLLHPADGLNNYYRVGVMRSQGYKAYKEMRTWFENGQEETICII